jgi:hypothetical protein
VPFLRFQIAENKWSKIIAIASKRRCWKNYNISKSSPLLGVLEKVLLIDADPQANTSSRVRDQA